MSTSQLASDGQIGNVTTDDLKAIRGIGPAIETRLHNAGVTTYEQLAGMSPADLAILFPDLILLSEDRITKEDWVGQARHLAVKHLNEPFANEEVLPVDGQHYAIFTVELLLDNTNTVRRTLVKHVQSQLEEKWAGWDGHHLIEYFSDKAGLHLASSESIPVLTQLEVETIQSWEVLGQMNPPGQLRFKRFEVIPSGTDQHSMTTIQDQPFDIHLTLGLSKVDVVSHHQMNYAASVYSKNMSNGFSSLVGEAQGSVETPDTFMVFMKGCRLPAGDHRLEAIAMVSPLTDDPRERPSLMAMLESQIIKVH
jgi:hypothetical protein